MAFNEVLENAVAASIARTMGTENSEVSLRDFADGVLDTQALNNVKDINTVITDDTTDPYIGDLLKQLGKTIVERRKSDN